MQIDKMTARLQSALADAQSLAVGKDHNYIEPVHLISVLLTSRGNSLVPMPGRWGG